MEAEALRQADRALHVQAALLRELVAPSPSGQVPADLADRVRRLGAETGARLTVVASDGVVLADSQADPSTMDNHAARPEFVQAARDGLGRATRTSATVRSDMSYLVLRVGTADRPQAFVRAAFPVSELRAELNRLRLVVIAGAVVAASLGLVASTVLVRRMTSPLEEVLVAAGSYAAGDYRPQVTPEGSDDVAQIAGAFNRMTLDLRGQMATLTDERNRLQAILGAMVEGVVAVDSTQLVVHANRAAARILGVDAGSTAGRRLWEVTRLRPILDAVAAALQSGAEARSEARALSQPQEVVVEVVVTPLRDAGGQVSGAVVVLHDVTELRRLETVRRDFVANVSHELKTPLQAIQGLVETVLDDGAMDAGVRQRFLGRIGEQSARLSSLVRDLLALARIESAEGALDRRPLDLREPVRESVSRLLVAAESKGLRLTADLPSDPVRIHGDEEALREVVDNLVDNAIKYTPSGGAARVTLRAEGDDAVLEVKDSGIGIEQAHVERIFERFYRVDKARSRELGGTGLGLSIVKHVVSAHGGRVSVESAPGEGSTFRVRLPLRPAA
jgi:two-component system phosphate regulon sensor histidine kinase PhoR